MLNLISRFVRNDSGAAAVEYGLLVALIAAVLIIIVGFLGQSLQQIFLTVCTAISDAATADGGTGPTCAIA